MMFRCRFTRRVAQALLVLLVLCSTGLLCAQQRARYVFFFIGDGMGLAQRTAAELHANRNAGPPGHPDYTRLVMNQLPTQGFTTTAADGSVITDSAAAGTALATGHKTGNGVISMSVDGKTPYKTVAELAHARGMAVGIVSSVSIDHATPACFYAHQPGRSSYYEIACQLPESGFQYFGGGGARGAFAKYLKGRPSPVELARKAGYRIVRSKEDLAALKPGGPVWAFAEKLDASAALPYEMDRPADQPSLADYVRAGIRVLDNDKGFFMVVEGGKIDWACHANDAAAAITDTLALDEAIRVALQFGRGHPDDTLIVVTADHETGGMSIGHTPTAYSYRPKLLGQEQSTEMFRQVVRTWKADGTAYAKALPVVLKTFGLDEPTRDELTALRRGFDASMAGRKSTVPSKTAKLIYGANDPLSVTAAHLAAGRVGIGWASFAHTGIPVPTSAWGIGHQRFAGHYDNTDVCRKLIAAMDLAESAAAK